MSKIVIYKANSETENAENPVYIMAVNEGRNTWYLNSYELKTYKFVLTGNKQKAHCYDMETIKKILEAENVKRYTVIN